MFAYVVEFLMFLRYLIMPLVCCDILMTIFFLIGDILVVAFLNSFQVLIFILYMPILVRSFLIYALLFAFVLIQFL